MLAGVDAAVPADMRRDSMPAANEKATGVFPGGLDSLPHGPVSRGPVRSQACAGSTLNSEGVLTAFARASIEARKRHTNSRVTSSSPG